MTGEMPRGPMNEGETGTAESQLTESQPTESNLGPMPSVNGPTDKAVEVSKASALWSTSWQELKSTCIYAPAAVSPSPDRIDVFAIGLNSIMYHNWWDGSKWNKWESLEDKPSKELCFTSAPAAVSPHSGRIDVFAISTDKQIYHKWWENSKWSDQWEPVKGSVAIHGLAATTWGDRIDLFAVGTDSCIYHNRWNNSQWSGWSPLKFKNQTNWETSSTCIYAPTAVYSNPERIDLFAVGIDNRIYHAWGDGILEWNGWEEVGGPCIYGVAAASSGNNRIHLLTIGTDTTATDNHMYHRLWDGYKWGSWEDLGGTCISAPAAVLRDENRLDAFVIGKRNAMWQKSWSKTGEGADAQSDGSPNYTHVQYIGYPIPTGIYKKLSKPKKNYIVITQKYLGYWDPNADWISRCTLMEEAIKLASEQPEVDRNESCLKIFMAPEFYFRGPVGAYELDIYQKIVGQLRTMVSDSKWKNWLFVFGTIVGCAELSNETIKEIYNTAFVQKGGMGEEGSGAIIKEFISTIDFAKIVTETEGGKTWDWQLEDERSLSKEEVQEIFSAPSGKGRENQLKNYDGRGIFEIDNITFGLEICLDHLDTVHRLRNSPPARGQKRVQIHLIPSAGMEINPKSVVAVRNGHVFNCDGANDGIPPLAANIFNHAIASEQAHTQIATVEIMYDRGTAPDTFKEPTDISNYTPRKIKVPLSEKVYTPLYFEDPGEIHIYQPLAIPPVSVVE